MREQPLLLLIIGRGRNEMAFDLQKFLSRIPQEIQIKASRASDRWRDKGFISHSHELWGNKLLAYAQTLPKGTTKTKLTEIGTFIKSNKALCYEDFYNYFTTYMDKPTTEAVLIAFQDKKGVLHRLEQMLRSRHPDIPEEVWRGIRT